MIWVSESIQEYLEKFRKIQADIHYIQPSIFMRTKFFSSILEIMIFSVLSPTSDILSFQ